MSSNLILKVAIVEKTINKKSWKNKEPKFLIKQTLKYKNEKKINQKNCKTKQKAIKRIMTKFDIKIKWNKMFW